MSLHLEEPYFQHSMAQMRLPIQMTFERTSTCLQAWSCMTITEALKSYVDNLFVILNGCIFELCADSTNFVSSRLYNRFCMGVDQLMCNQISYCKSSEIPHERLTIKQSYYLLACYAKCQVSDVRFIGKVKLNFNILYLIGHV